ncbi:MAG: gephyrin-like molybdotransferase Glp [Acidobacteriota bacterium]
MIPVSKAFNIIDDEVSAIGPERIAVENAVGRVLAENIVADMDMPPFNRSQMDGFAVRAVDVADAPVVLRLVGESAAGRGWHDRMKRGESVRIMTGAPIPLGADTVQKLELALETSSQDANEEITILESVEKGKFIVTKGSEIRKGAVLFQKGSLVSEGMIAGIAAFGYSTLEVAKRPAVAVLSTGSEIVPIDRIPGRDQIRNSNSLMLKALCEQAGASTKLLPISGDHLEKLKARISKAANDDKTDVLVITGGVSVGKYDLTKAALRELEAEIYFERVRLKPGKPAVFARLGKMLIFGLPGNPVSSAVTFYLFVRRAIRRMQGASEIGLRSGYARTSRRLKGAAERETYLPIALKTSNDATLIAEALKWGGSSDFVGFANAEALAKIPRGRIYEESEIVEIVYI